MNNNPTNAEYHADMSHLSSSALKLLLKDPAAFKLKYIEGKHEHSEKEVFDIGTYVHALCLEPNTIAQNFAFYEGLRKAGNAYKNFAEQNSGKIILSAPQKLKSEQFYKAYQKRGDAVSMLQGGFAEHTMTGVLLDVPVKARADYINIDKSYIVDIKTTSYPSHVDIFKQTVEQYGYDLSAALYCSIAKQNYSKDFAFYFVVISKTDLVCEVYKLSEATASKGLTLLNVSLLMYKNKAWEGRKQEDTFNFEILEV